MQKWSGVISALCYLIPIIVAEWLKIPHLFLATVFLGSRKVLFSSFYGNGDRGVKKHFCGGSRKPLWLHRDVWKTATVLLFTCWLGLGLAGWTCQCACSGGCGQALSTEVLLLWQESMRGSTARQHPAVPAVLGSGDRFLTVTGNVGCTLDRETALVTQTWFIYLHSAKHNRYETKRCQLSQQEET